MGLSRTQSIGTAARRCYHLPVPQWLRDRWVTVLLAMAAMLSFVVPTSFWVGPDQKIYRTYTGRLDRRKMASDLQVLVRGR